MSFRLALCRERSHGQILTLRGAVGAILLAWLHLPPVLPRRPRLTLYAADEPLALLQWARRLVLTCRVRAIIYAPGATASFVENIFISLSRRFFWP